MLASGTPRPLSAAPDASASSRKVPSRWFIQSMFSLPSLATYRSVHPSPSKSAVATPSAAPKRPPTSAVSLTSTKRPRPRLRYRRSGVPPYTCGGQ